MKEIRWNEEKNDFLKRERGVGFEDVLVAIDEDRLLDVLEHTNQKKYPEQRMFIVDIGQYAYLVPFVENKTEIFLKTIIPSRKATKQYLIHKQ